VDRRRKITGLHRTITSQIVRQDVVRIKRRNFVENSESALVLVRTKCGHALLEFRFDVGGARGRLLGGGQTCHHQQRGA